MKQTCPPKPGYFYYDSCDNSYLLVLKVINTTTEYKYKVKYFNYKGYDDIIAYRDEGYINIYYTLISK